MPDPDDIRETLQKDAVAALAVTLLAVPQGIAYAVIAGLPPAAGLYAAAWPAILGSLARSSPYVATGPTNALSLLVGSAIVGQSVGASPLQSAMLLALMVGGFQLAAGLLRLGALVDYISRAVVLGYITGAGTLIAVGQLGNVTGTSMGTGDPFTRLATWAGSLGRTDPRALLLALGAAGTILWIRRSRPSFPAASVVLVTCIAVSWLLDLPSKGFAVAGDLAPVPWGLPPLGPPELSFARFRDLAAPAMAVAVLSLVEGSSVARSIAAETGDRVDMSREFVGSGLANVTAGLTGGYPVSGSLTRSVLNKRAGARTRLSGVLSGVLVLAILLLFGPVVDYTPLAALAGLLLVIAWDLVDRPAITNVLGSLWGDRLAFVGTLVGTWVFELDDAIYVGVLISVILFLRRSRVLRVSELIVVDGRLRESIRDADSPPLPAGSHCSAIRVVHVEGSLFFGAANELQDALDDAAADPAVQVVVVRLKRARGMDYTCAGVLIAVHERLAREGRHLELVGMLPPTMALFERVGLTRVFEQDELYPTEKEWFVAMDRALAHARELVPDDHEPDCPLDGYLASRKALREGGMPDASDDSDAPDEGPTLLPSPSERERG